MPPIPAERNAAILTGLARRRSLRRATRARQEKQTAAHQGRYHSKPKTTGPMPVRLRSARARLRGIRPVGGSNGPGAGMTEAGVPYTAESYGPPCPLQTRAHLRLHRSEHWSLVRATPGASLDSNFPDGGRGGAAQVRAVRHDAEVSAGRRFPSRTHPVDTRPKRIPWGRATA